MEYVKGDERNKKLLRIAGNAGVFDLLYETFLSTENAIHIMEILAEGLSVEFVRKNIDESGSKNEHVVHENTKAATQFESKSANSITQVEVEQRKSYQTKEE